MVMIFVVLVVVGLCLGSFVNALVWRLHEQEKGTANEERRTKKKKTQLQKASIHRSSFIVHRSPNSLSILQGRSMCPHCKHQLAAKDLVPVFSWISLSGKCRYCHKPISWQYPVVELLTAGLFIASYIYWPSGFHGGGLFEFVLWLVFVTGLVALVIYDLLWFELPNRIIYPLTALAALQVLIVAIFYGGGVNSLFGAVWGVLVIGGLFYVIFQISKGRWIGGGDVKLGALLGLLVGGPLASILVLFLASLGGTIIAVPLLATGKAKRDTHLPFGPFLIIAAIIVRLFDASMIAWYKSRVGY